MTATARVDCDKVYRDMLWDGDLLAKSEQIINGGGRTAGEVYMTCREYPKGLTSVQEEIRRLDAGWLEDALELQSGHLGKSVYAMARAMGIDEDRAIAIGCFAAQDCLSEMHHGLIADALDMHEEMRETGSRR